MSIVRFSGHCPNSLCSFFSRQERLCTNYIAAEPLVYIVYNSLFASVHVYKMMLKPFMLALYAGRNVFHRFAIVNGLIRVLNPMRILSALDVEFLQNACADVLRLPRHRPFLRAFPQDSIQNAAPPHLRAVDVGRTCAELEVEQLR